MYKVINFLLIFLLCSCSINDFFLNDDYIHHNTNDDYIFTYAYDFQYFGLDNENCSIKATTVSSLKSAIDNKRTAIFLLSSPLCVSCKSFVSVVNKIGLDRNISIYDIDLYSEQYPVFETKDFDILINILLNSVITDKNDFAIPMLLIVNKGKITDYILSNDYHPNDYSDDQIYSQIDEVLSKSLIY